MVKDNSPDSVETSECVENSDGRLIEEIIYVHTLLRALSPNSEFATKTSTSDLIHC